MCGICGFNFEDRKLVEKMNATIRHRGPDDSGVFVGNGVSFGFSRLAIIDLRHEASQPMWNNAKDVVIVFNGEIYNFKELRKELEKDYSFKTEGDTEVILAAYEKWGSDFIKKLNGMFALAIFDRKKSELLIARDHLGIKPLYYYHNGNRLIFASEIKCILEHSEVKRKINMSCLKQMVHYEYPHDGSTLIEGVNELKPGHYMIAKNGKIDMKKYWEIVVREDDKPESYYVGKLREILSDSVRRQLVSDRPIGISLSGGIDSSVIVALASKMSSKPVKTFTLGFGVPEDEYSVARIVANHCKTEHKEIRVSAKDYADALVKVLWHYERPFSKPAIVPVYYLYEGIHKELTVSLSGEGSDELFGGYRRYDAYSELPKSKSGMSDEEYAKLKSRIGMSYEDKARYVTSSAFSGQAHEFFAEEFLKLSPNEDVMNTFGPRIKGLESDGSQLNQALKYELETEIPYFHCKKLDTMSMASSHEVRVPYLDPRVVEFAMTIPARYKFYGNDRKIILRKLAEELLPREIVERKKQPIATPIGDYFARELASIAEKVLTRDKLSERGIYNVDRVMRLLNDVKENRITKEQTESSRGNPFRQLLFIVTLELWIARFIENKLDI